MGHRVRQVPGARHRHKAGGAMTDPARIAPDTRTAPTAGAGGSSKRPRPIHALSSTCVSGCWLLVLLATVSGSITSACSQGPLPISQTVLDGERLGGSRRRVRPAAERVFTTVGDREVP